MSNVIQVGSKFFKEQGTYEGVKCYEVLGNPNVAIVSQTTLSNMQRDYSLDRLTPGNLIEITYINPLTGHFEDNETITA